MTQVIPVPDGSTEVVSVHRLAAGDRVRVPVGQAFPADGVLLHGTTQADEALSVLDVQMTPASSDGYYRSVYENTVALRNRLFGN